MSFFRNIVKNIAGKDLSEHEILTVARYFVERQVSNILAMFLAYMRHILNLFEMFLFSFYWCLYKNHLRF